MRTTLFALLVIGLAATGFAALRSPDAPPNLDRALAAQEALAAERPNDPLVLNDLGNLLVVTGRPHEAEEAYRRALELAPEMASAHYNLGLLLLQRTELGAAREHFEAVLEAQPENAWAHYQVGAVLDAQGTKRKAVKHYTQAFRLDPQLAFPEVNPHVIDNDHVTEALLMAYRNLPSSAEAPKTYEDPSRIVSLMLASEQETVPDTPEMMEDEGMEPPRPDEPGEAGVGPPSIPPVAAPSSAGSEAGEGEEPSSGRVLRKEDLERESGLNQAAPQGSVYYPPQGGVRNRSQDLRERYRPPTAPQRPGSTGGSSGANTRRIEPSTPGRFTPGIPSTGRLDIELLPGAGEAPGTGAADPAAVPAG